MSAVVSSQAQLTSPHTEAVTHTSVKIRAIELPFSAELLMVRLHELWKQAAQGQHRMGGCLSRRGPRAGGGALVAGGLRWSCPHRCVTAPGSREGQETTLHLLSAYFVPGAVPGTLPT